MKATPEQEAWTQGYDACFTSVKQRLNDTISTLDTMIAVAIATNDEARRRDYTTAKQLLKAEFSDLGFPFHTQERIS